MEQPEKLLDLLQKGGAAQSNGGSVTGVFGPRVQHNVEQLLEQQLIAFMGSDAHNLRHRNTNLKTAREIIAERWGTETATTLFETLPLHILQNKAFSPDVYQNKLPENITVQPYKHHTSPQQPQKKKGFFARLFS